MANEHLVNCKNQAEEDRELEYRAELRENEAVVAVRQRREMALAYLKQRASCPDLVLPLTVQDLKELLILLGLDE